MPDPDQPDQPNQPGALSGAYSDDSALPVPPVATPVDLSSESVAGEEDPGAAMDTTMKRD